MGTERDMTINVLEARNNLSALIRRIESGEESEIVISRRGVPVAKLVPLDAGDGVACRIGAARGNRLIRDGYDFDAPDADVESLFEEAF